MDERRKQRLVWIGCVAAAVMLCLFFINHPTRIDEENRSEMLRRLANEIGGASEPNAEWQAGIEQINREQAEQARERSQNAVNSPAPTEPK